MNREITYKSKKTPGKELVVHYFEDRIIARSFHMNGKRHGLTTVYNVVGLSSISTYTNDVCDEYIHYNDDGTFFGISTRYGINKIIQRFDEGEICELEYVIN